MNKNLTLAVFTLFQKIYIPKYLPIVVDKDDESSPA